MRIAQTVSARDPVLDQFGKFLIFVLITEMAAVLENGQGTLGKPFVQSLCIVGCQESVLITPKKHEPAHRVYPDADQSLWSLPGNA